MKLRLLSILIACAIGFVACSTPPAARYAPMGSTVAKKAKTVVFIHGMFMTPASWAEWQKYFEKKGYKTLAPAWPLHDRSVEEQKKAHPDPKLAAVTLKDVLDTYRAAISKLDEKPILIGHSMGGLVVQLLMQEGLGSAGIAIDSAPPNGVISTKYSFLKSNWGVISPFADEDEPIYPSQEQFNYMFLNNLDEAGQKAVYEKYAVPESRRVGKGPTTDLAKIDFDKSRGPLLFIAGGDDHIIPASLNYKNFAKYSDSKSITEFKLFEGRTHWTCGEKGWEQVADFSLAWIDGLK